MIALLIIGDHAVKPVAEQTMERHRSRTIAPKPVRRGFLSDRDWDKCAEIISVDAWSAAPMTSGRSTRDGGGVTTPESDCTDQGVARRTDPARDQVQAIRRSLWILSATLESLPAKIELACRRSGAVAGRDGLDQPQHTRDVRLRLKALGALGGWRARWKCARLRSRANRAERRAAVAIRDASASFGAALEAVLHAAVARAKADQACLVSCCVPAPPSRDQGDDRETIGPLERNFS
jgi:hypothetical protein